MQRRARNVWAFFDRHRTQVWLDPGGENLVRAHPQCSNRWQVMVQGWPNLVHELAHVLQAGCLGEDSGFEYHLVPLDLQTPRGRGYLWDELGACALSCAWGASARGDAWVADWFCEQVEILPVFFGDEDDPQRFLQGVDRCLIEHGEELAWAQARLWSMAHTLSERGDPGEGLCSFPGRSSVRDWIDAGSGPLPWSSSMREVQGPFRVETLWQRYRSASSGVGGSHEEVVGRYDTELTVSPGGAEKSESAHL